MTTNVEELGEPQETYLCNIARITGEESVAATLEGRRADVDAVNAQLNQYMMSNFAAVTENVSRRMDEMAPPAGHECDSGDDDAQSRCRAFMRARAREMREQGFDHPQ